MLRRPGTASIYGVRPFARKDPGHFAEHDLGIIALIYRGYRLACLARKSRSGTQDREPTDRGLGLRDNEVSEIERLKRASSIGSRSASSCHYVATALLETPIIAADSPSGRVGVLMEERGMGHEPKDWTP